jgi:hypothetical protein
MGAILLQKKSDGKKHPIAYYSKTLSVAEHNYNVYDLELLALVSTLDHWQHYLAGSPHKISCCIAGEVLMLSEYNFEIHHIKGVMNRQADALSRRPDYDQGKEDNQDITVLPEQVFARAVEVIPNYTAQDKTTLKPWIDPHQLKQPEYMV